LSGGGRPKLVHTFVPTDPPLELTSYTHFDHRKENKGNPLILACSLRRTESSGVLTTTSPRLDASKEK